MSFTIKYEGLFDDNAVDLKLTTQPTRIQAVRVINRSPFDLLFIGLPGLGQVWHEAYKSELYPISQLITYSGIVHFTAKMHSNIVPYHSVGGTGEYDVLFNVYELDDVIPNVESYSTPVMSPEDVGSINLINVIGLIDAAAGAAASTTLTADTNASLLAIDKIYMVFSVPSVTNVGADATLTHIAGDTSGTDTTQRFKIRMFTGAIYVMDINFNPPLMCVGKTTTFSVPAIANGGGYTGQVYGHNIYTSGKIAGSIP